MNSFRIVVGMIWMFLWNSAAADSLPEVNIYSEVVFLSEPSGSGGFSIHKNTNSPLVVHVQMEGTATLGVDYKIKTNYLAITVGTNSDFYITMDSIDSDVVYVSVNILDDSENEPDESIVMRLVPDANYEIGDASLAAIRLRSNPLPKVWFDFIGQNLTEIDPSAPFQFTVITWLSVNSLSMYVDDKLFATANTGTKFDSLQQYRVTWPPQRGRHEISAVVKDVHGASVRIATTVHVVDGLIKPEAIARTLDGTTIVPYTGVTTFDSSGRAGVFVEFSVPQWATNWTALLFADNWGSAAQNQLFANPGDGVVDPNDLRADFEFVGAIESVTQIDVTPWVHRYAGGHLGLKLRVDPTLGLFTQENGVDAAHFDNFRIVLFSPTNDVPGRVQWLNFPFRTGYWSDQPLRIDLETFDPDSRVKSIQVNATTYTSTQTLTLNVDLPPGTNNVSIIWTNTSVGTETFSVEMKLDSETVTHTFGGVTFYPHSTNEPAHRWLTTDAENASFYVVDAAGRAWVWGYNSYGQLGLGFKSDVVTRPTMLAPPTGKKWRQFSSNSHAAVGLADDGSYYAMGSYNFTGTVKETLVPQLISPPAPEGFTKRVALVDAGLWVINVWDSLIQVLGLSGGVGAPGNIAAIDGANTQILALLKDGTLDPRPRTNNGAILPWVAISTSGHELAIDSAGQMFGWGDNSVGQLPVRNVTYSDVPVKAAPPPSGGTWTKICAGNQVNLAVDSSGHLFAWGRRGMTGSTNYTANLPIRVDVPSDEIGWLDLSVQSTTALALSTRGNLYTWSYNTKPHVVEGLPPLLDESSTASYATFDPGSVSFSESFAVDVIGGPRSGAVQTSSDLIHWDTVTNLDNTTGKARLTLPAVRSSNLFVRVRDAL